MEESVSENAEEKKSKIVRYLQKVVNEASKKHNMR